MPSTATITAYYSFTAGTKAKASEVTNNFANHRGHQIPINTDTATASHQTHDLGSADHQWRTLYLQNPPVVNGAQAGKFAIETVSPGDYPPNYEGDIADVTRIGFLGNTDSDVRFSFIVDSDYQSGNPISLDIRGFSDDTGGSTFIASSALYKDSITNIGLTAPANTFTTTSNINMPSTTGLFFKNTTLRITGAGGTIGSVLVANGDKITVNLKRSGTATADTMAGSVFLTDVLVDLNL